MKKTIWISALVPTEGADTYDGIRIAISDTEEEAFDDLFEWLCDCGACDEDVPEVGTLLGIRELLNDSQAVRFWNVESSEVTFTPPAVVRIPDPNQEAQSAR